jgi:hypothetical protein
MGMENYWQQSMHNLQPVFDFISPVTNAATNFLTSGSKYDANESAGSNFVNSFTTPSNLFDDNFMSDNMDLTYGGGEVPEFDGVSSLPPIVINKNPNELYDPSTFVNDNSPMNEAAGYPNYYKPTEQINPAGVTSADGMMTEPAMYLYPGEAIGIDGVPYRPSAGASTTSSGGGSNNSGGSNSAGSYPVSNVLNTRRFPFTSRTPSGSVYAPDLSAYNDSSLFNYEGPGGVPEYTYGQGLRTGGADYSIFGSPADAANPYFAGQFATPAGPADAAINMPAVELPSGVQPISADVSMPGFTGGNQIIGESLSSGITPRPPSSAGDLTYQQTIDEMGIFGPNNPPPSTLFPSPGQTTANEQNIVAGNIAGTPDNSMMDNQTAADAAMGNRMGYPDNLFAGASAMDDTANIERGMFTSQRGTTMDDTADIEAGMSRVPTDMQRYLDDFEARGITDRTQQIMDYAKQNNNVIDGITIFDEGDPRQIFQDAILNPQPKRENNPIYGGLDGIPLDNSFMMSDGPLARNTGKPFKPEGVEGVDYYQDVTGNYFDINDDLGTQPLKPVPDMMSAGPDSRGARGDSSRPLTEAELAPDTGELTSGDMGALNDAMTAIDAKYAGSKTDASAEAELKEILNATLNAFGGGGSTNARGARGETVPADIPAFLNQDISRMADKYVPSPAESDYPLAYQSYARENEGTSTGESLFQNVAEDIPLSVFNPIDRVVMQAEAQAAQVAAAQAQAAAAAQAQAAAQARAAAEAEARRNPPPPPPRVTVNYNRNKPTPVVRSKPTPRGPQPSKPTRTTGSRGGRGNVSASRRLTGGR